MSAPPNARATRWTDWAVNAARTRVVLLGFLLGTLFFAISLTPSLLPRTYLVQGVLSGISFAIGYGIGAALQWLWTYMELRLPRQRWSDWIKWALLLATLIFASYCLYQTSSWQDGVRRVMGAGPVESEHPLQVLGVALLPAVALVVLGTLLVHGVRWVSRQLMRVVPRRVAFVGSVIIVTIVTTTLVNGVLLRAALRAADGFFEQLDSVAGQFGGAAPSELLSSGSAASLVAWDSIGRDGRIYVESGPSAAQIEATIGRPALQPLRVYVGLRSAPTTAARAQLALAEMRRVGAFDRSVLVVIMPVGTGWVDPPGIDTLEYLQAGDVASVALQYSYLTSPLSLIVEPDYGTAAAQALFHAVYEYWSALPHERRPKLYLNGLSLGAHSSQASTQVFDVLGDPFQGALWVGPPFTSPIWSWATANRQPQSPEWLPRFGNDTSIRFSNDGSGLSMPDVPWGPIRIAFLQHASDPVVFFDWSALYRAPDWMGGERGPDVPVALHWFPVVTLLQLGLDMALGQTAPAGHGHLYTSAEYIDAWRALIEPAGWDNASIAALKARLQ